MAREMWTMRSTDELKDEHRTIEQVLAFYRAVARVAEDGGVLPVDSLRDALEFTRSFVDRFHQAKEEGVLFERLERTGMPRQAGPLAVMLTDHEEGRCHVAALAEGVERYAAGDTSAGAEVGDAARGYADLFAQHIYQEDHILYVMAEQLCTGDDEEILEEYRTADRAGMTQERRQRYLGVAARLGEEAEALEAALGA
jgi:hemerythrin-like domain-containing protein